MIPEKDYVKNNEIQKSKQLKSDVEHLSAKLRNIRKQKPNLSNSFNLEGQSPRFSLAIVQNASKHLQQSQRNTGQSSIKQKVKAQKCKINWNISANIMTREKSPSHAIPRATRFNQTKRQTQNFFPQLTLNLRTSLDKTGISFARSNRKQLFKPYMITPSPHQYKLKRYLQNLSEQPRTHISVLTQNQEEDMEHIKGGAINKFSRHEQLFYPHTKKLNYNEKTIKQQEERVRRVKKNQKVDGANWFATL